MKNFIIALAACVLIGGLVYFGLTKFTDIGGGAEQKNSEFVFEEDYSSILTDYKTWSKYNRENIELAYDFKPFDENGEEITKEAFLEKLKSGTFIPVKGVGEGFSYKLIPLGEDVDPKIGRSVKGGAKSVFHYFKLEGQPLPKFDLTDLNGNNYSSESLAGKIIVIKCWFIQCKVCVEEFPELNVLYDRYEGNDNVEFVSVAFDKAEKLKTFLSKKEFRYPVVPEQQNFIMKEIKAKQFPLHVLVDQEGNVIKMVNNVKTLIHYLDETVAELEE